MLCYLCGLACSVILPGLAGGAFTVTCIAIAIVLTLIFSGELIGWLCVYLKLFNEITQGVQLSMLGMPAGIVAFAVLGLWLGRRVGGACRTLPRLYATHQALPPKFMLRCSSGV